jgi:ABC-2 type transport system ATP-binding protein
LLLPRLRDELGLTILLCSHLLDEVERVCNTVAIIDHGHLLYQGPMESLLLEKTSVKITVDRPDVAYELRCLTHTSQSAATVPTRFT